MSFNQGNRTVKYYFGRLNLISAEKNKYDLLIRGLTARKNLSVGAFYWGFFDVDEVSASNGAFVHGYLVKFRPEYLEQVANPRTHNLEDQSVANFVVAKSRFFLHVHSGVICYHPVGSSISRGVFVDRFCKLFEFSFDNFFINADIQSIEDDYKIFDELEKFNKIFKIQIYLHPSNPSNRERWQRTDDRLKLINASKYTEFIEANPDGGSLNILADPEIKSKIAMANDGYGKADVTGEIGGTQKTISTSDNPITVRVPSDKTPKEIVLEFLLKTFKDVLGRFIK